MKTLLALVACLLMLPAAAAEPTKMDPLVQRFLHGPPLAAKASGGNGMETYGRIDDRAFLRRVTLDLTGRLPDQAHLNAFLADQRPDKRALVIDELLATEAFVYRWTTFFEDMFWNHGITEGALYRNAFHDSLTQMVKDNVSWDRMAQRLLTDQGVAVREGSSFNFWGVEAILADYRLDYLDDQIGVITETMLGLQTDCISCHDGAYHLEEVNKGLSVMTREQFWGMAAFLAKSAIYFPRDYEDYKDDEQQMYRELQYIDLDDPGFSSGDGFVAVEYHFMDGEYRAFSEAGDGMRTPRNGGVIQPRYLTSGEGPAPGETRRQALARLITTDRQFARNMVNRVWANFFGEGFVQPVNAWDLGRIDAATAAVHGATVQARHPQLMEYLTDQFIAMGYDMRGLMRLIGNSALYQAHFTDTARPQSVAPDSLALWRSRMRVQRVDAETVVDSIFSILGLEFRYVVTGMWDRDITSAWQFPDNYEPNPWTLLGPDEEPLIDVTTLGYENFEQLEIVNYLAMDLMMNFGVSDRFNRVPRDNDSSIQTSLLMMNFEGVNLWFLEGDYSPYLLALRREVDSGRLGREQAVAALFDRILVRRPSEAESALFTNYFNGKATNRALADLTWTLFNHPDFLYRR